MKRRITIEDKLEAKKSLEELLDDELDFDVVDEGKQVPYNEVKSHLDDDEYFDVIEFVFMDNL